VLELLGRHVREAVLERFFEINDPVTVSVNCRKVVEQPQHSEEKKGYYWMIKSMIR
jgi:hypothetical protein